MSQPKSFRPKSGAGVSIRTRISFVIVALLAVAVAAMMLLRTYLPAPTAPAPPQATSAPPAITATTTASATNRPADTAGKSKLSVLVGRWQRTDGSYAIDIQSVAANGEMRAGYFNPRPIKVGRAEAFEKDGKAQMYLELRDENYPGSYYSLAFDPATGMLAGIYFQATQRETYEVEFVRLR
jgi:uncharacterized protein (DUF2147 family)